MFQGMLAGRGAFTKTGAGTLTLNGTNPLTGAFNVQQGTLAINGAFGGSLNVASGAALRASGFIAGSLTVAGSLFAIPQADGSTQAIIGDAARVGVRAGAEPECAAGARIGRQPGIDAGFAHRFRDRSGCESGGAGWRRRVAQRHAFQRHVAVARNRTFGVVSSAITAVSSITMQNADVVSADPNVVPLLKEDRNALFVTLVNLNVPLATPTADPNRRGVADDDRSDQSSALHRRSSATVIKELTALDDAGLNAALEQIEGQIHASALQTAVLDADAFTDIARTQAGTPREPDQSGSVHFWTDFNCQTANYKGNNNTQGGSASACCGRRRRRQVDLRSLDARQQRRSSAAAASGSADWDQRLPCAARVRPARGMEAEDLRGSTSGAAAPAVAVICRRSGTSSSPRRCRPNLGGEAITNGVDRQAQSTQQGTSSDHRSEIQEQPQEDSYVL